MVFKHVYHVGPNNIVNNTSRGGGGVTFKSGGSSVGLLVIVEHFVGLPDRVLNMSYTGLSVFTNKTIIRQC